MTNEPSRKALALQKYLALVEERLLPLVKQEAHGSYSYTFHIESGVVTRITEAFERSLKAS